MSSFP